MLGWINANKRKVLKSVKAVSMPENIWTDDMTESAVQQKSIEEESEQN